MARAHDVWGKKSSQRSNACAKKVLIFTCKLVRHLVPTKKCPSYVAGALSRKKGPPDWDLDPRPLVLAKLVGLTATLACLSGLWSLIGESNPGP